MKCQAEWSPSWNQDCQEKYQQPQICRWHHPYGRKRRGTEESPNEGERGEWKSWLKTQHSKTKIMASGPITSWQIDGETMETVTDFIFLGSKITADCDWSHKIRSCLLLERKVMTNLLQFSSVTLSCPTLCDPMDCSPPSSSVYGILQARILEWVAMPYSGGCSQPRDRTHGSSALAGVFFTTSTTYNIKPSNRFKVIF